MFPWGDIAKKSLLRLSPGEASKSSKSETFFPPLLCLWLDPAGKGFRGEESRRAVKCLIQIAETHKRKWARRLDWPGHQDSLWNIGRNRSGPPKDQKLIHKKKISD